MAKPATPTTPTTNGKPRNKRESGYAVTIKGFIRTNVDDIDGQLAVLQAVKQARAGDLEAAVKLMGGLEIALKPTTRTVEAT